nr:hypothetical protein [Tanacetum cinerariifolium]
MTRYNDVIGNQNQIGNGNLVAARAEGNAAGQNGNQIRCYNYRGVGHYARNCTIGPMRRDAAYLQTQLLIAQKEEAGIQLQVEEYDLMAAAVDLDEIVEVNANCILMANMQQASTLGTQTNKAPFYDLDGSAEVHENCDDNEIFNMFTQDEQYTELLEPIPELHQVPQNDNNVIPEVTSVEQSGEIVDQHPANFEETRALYDSLYQNLAIEVEKVNSINRKSKETNADLTTELARFKNQSRNQVIQNAVQNPRIQNDGNQNGLIVVPWNVNRNPNRNGNLVAARAEGNATGHNAGQNGNQIRCYNCRGVGHYAWNCMVRPMRRDAAYLQTQLLIAQKEEARIQLQAKEFDLMAAAADLDEIEEVNAYCILMANLQQALTSTTQSDKAPVYDSDGSVEVHDYENCDDNEIFNMFTQEGQYTELLEPILDQHQVPQNDNHVIYKVTSVEQSGETVEQHPVNFEETRAL